MPFSGTLQMAVLKVGMKHRGHSREYHGGACACLEQIHMLFLAFWGVWFVKQNWECRRQEQLFLSSRRKMHWLINAGLDKVQLSCFQQQKCKPSAGVTQKGQMVCAGTAAGNAHITRLTQSCHLPPHLFGFPVHCSVLWTTPVSVSGLSWEEQPLLPQWIWEKNPGSPSGLAEMAF